jgi:hypothetical protein
VAHVRALQRLGLLAEGQHSQAEVGAAVARFLDGAAPLSALAAALAPDGAQAITPPPLGNRQEKGSGHHAVDRFNGRKRA